MIDRTISLVSALAISFLCASCIQSTSNNAKGGKADQSDLVSSTSREVSSTSFPEALLCENLRSTASNGQARAVQNEETDASLQITGTGSFAETYKPTDRIANGQLATAAQSVGVVSLLVSLKSGASGGCTGSLISDEWVLTASHCFFNISNESDVVSEVKVFSGRNRFGGVAVKGSAFCHKDYGFRSGAYANDVALVRLERTLPAPTMLLVRRSDYAVSSRSTESIVSILGFGKLSPTQNADKLMIGEVKTRPRSNGCSGKNVFCTQTTDLLGRAPSSLCPGDSGGPAKARFADGSERQVGINSYVFNVNYGESPACGKAGNVSAMVDIFQYLDWIEGVVLED